MIHFSSDSLGTKLGSCSHRISPACSQRRQLHRKEAFILSDTIFTFTFISSNVNNYKLCVYHQQDSRDPMRLLTTLDALHHVCRCSFWVRYTGLSTITCCTWMLAPTPCATSSASPSAGWPTCECCPASGRSPPPGPPSTSCALNWRWATGVSKRI